ncbi:hypothetical protein MalM14_16910 [Gimesia chilikensis]|nr:hypothetical protein MalM14_16910 [Gimesia chilikensis]
MWLSDATTNNRLEIKTTRGLFRIQQKDAGTHFQVRSQRPIFRIKFNQRGNVTAAGTLWGSDPVRDGRPDS